MVHILYQTTNLLNGRYYIGVHSTKDLEDGYLGSGKLITRAVKKYGAENFQRIVLRTFESKEEAYEAERLLVDVDFINDRKTYNVRPGGRGGFSPSTIKKANRGASRALKGRTYEEIHGFEKAVVLKQAKGLNWLGADQSGVNNANFGKHWSPEKRAEFASRRQKEDHPGFGSFWITNGIDSRKVQPGAVIEPGWRKGRVIRRPQQ